MNAHTTQSRRPRLEQLEGRDCPSSFVSNGDLWAYRSDVVPQDQVTVDMAQARHITKFTDLLIASRGDEVNRVAVAPSQAAYVKVWIEVDSFGFGVANSAQPGAETTFDFHRGNGDNDVTAEASFNFTKVTVSYAETPAGVCKASPLLFL